MEHFVFPVEVLDPQTSNLPYSEAIDSQQH